MTAASAPPSRGRLRPNAMQQEGGRGRAHRRGRRSGRALEAERVGQRHPRRPRPKRAHSRARSQEGRIRAWSRARRRAERQARTPSYPAKLKSSSVKARARRPRRVPVRAAGGDPDQRPRMADRRDRRQAAAGGLARRPHAVRDARPGHAHRGSRMDAPSTAPWSTAARGPRSTVPAGACGCPPEFAASRARSNGASCGCSSASPAC